MKTHHHLSRRERQIMDVIYQRGQATAGEVLDALPDPPSYSAVRALLRILEDKGHLQHYEKGSKYVYLPTVSPRAARKTAIRHVVQTFFGGSAFDATCTLIDDSSLTDKDKDKLQALLARARREGR